MSGKLFVVCLEFTNENTEDHGTFQMIVEGGDVADAAAKTRDRLDTLARTTDILGPVLVLLTAIIEISSPDLARGVLVNHQELGGCVAYDHLPTQALGGTTVDYFEAPPSDDSSAESELGSLSWSGIEIYESRWKLFWCETDDHDEDWFVVAKSADEAAAFHEDAEGYDEGDASSEMVCLVPLSPQAQVSEPGWPSNDLLLACGAEFLPNIPQDGDNALRQMMDSGARVVRIADRIYSEGDIVSNTSWIRRLGNPPSGRSPPWAAVSSADRTESPLPAGAISSQRGRAPAPSLVESR